MPTLDYVFKSCIFKEAELSSLFHPAFIKNFLRIWVQKHLMLCPSVSYVET